MEADSQLVTTRVLLVEDHAAFRHYVRSALAARPQLQVIAEAADGLEAIEKCLQLKPDVVLMDIGLPRLNGIEAARRILARVPSCKIIFLTQERAPEIMHEALKLGASGYVVKTRAAKDLFPALAAAGNGGRFVSSDGAPSPSGGRQQSESGTNATTGESLPTGGSHEAHIYPDDESFVTGLASFIERSLRAQKAVLAFLSAHRDAVLTAVQARGADIEHAIATGRLVTFDDFQLLAELLAESQANPDCLMTASVGMLEKLMNTNPGRRIAVCGECGSALFAEARGELALKVEDVWDEIARKYGIQAFCAYLLSDTLHDRPAYQRLAAAHSLLAAH